jgi:hypothetical protein
MIVGFLAVIPAQAGIQEFQAILDPRFTGMFRISY